MLSGCCSGCCGRCRRSQSYVWEAIRPGNGEDHRGIALYSTACEKQGQVWKCKYWPSNEEVIIKNTNILRTKCSIDYGISWKSCVHAVPSIVHSAIFDSHRKSLNHSPLLPISGNHCLAIAAGTSHEPPRDQPACLVLCLRLLLITRIRCNQTESDSQPMQKKNQHHLSSKN